MCFDVAPSAYRSVQAAPIFRSFEPSPWHVAAWKWLLEKQLLGKHFFAIGIVLVQKSLQLTVLNLPGPIFTLLVTQVKIVVIEPRRNQSLHVVSVVRKALSP